MRSPRLWILAITGVGITVAGIWTAHSATTAEFGWFAYSPLTDAVQVPRIATGRALAGWVFAASGLMLLSGLVGYVLGTRRGGSSLD